MGFLLSDLLLSAADRQPEAAALLSDKASLSYGELASRVEALAASFIALGLGRGARVAVWLDKNPDCVVACLAAAHAGLVFVPVNPVLKPAQVRHIAANSGAALMVTQAARWLRWADEVAPLPGLQVLLTDGPPLGDSLGAPMDWQQALSSRPRPGHRVLDADLVAILYTSGSTGQPKGVMLSHRNMVVGAHSVAAYLGNTSEDRLLAALPISFDAGFSQLTTAFSVGASVALLTPLLPRDVLHALDRFQITGLTAVPPLYIQLSQLDWPAAINEHLRYFANTGGRMPRETLQLLRQRVPAAKPFLMYGLTEAFRSTFLPPDQVDTRPDSIGKAIPNAEILVLREDGTECAADEPGELVHRGALVGLGYWNDAEKTAERYKPLPAGVGGREAGMQLPEYAVFSGDTVRRDAEGFLYFIGRRDEMMKTSGYRVSPTEVEEILYATQLVGECVAFGVDNEALGQAIQVIATPPVGASQVDTVALLAECRKRMPAYMVPAGIEQQAGPLPRNPNGKIDRKLLSTAWVEKHNTQAPRRHD